MLERAGKGGKDVRPRFFVGSKRDRTIDAADAGAVNGR
jgi:hypothetical protein